MAALRAAGAVKVFHEVTSGAQTNRSQLGKALSAFGVGDVLMVMRRNRSTRDLLNTLAAITKPRRDSEPRERGAESLTEICDSYYVSTATILRLAG